MKEISSKSISDPSKSDFSAVLETEATWQSIVACVGSTEVEARREATLSRSFSGRRVRAKAATASSQWGDFIFLTIRWKMLAFNDWMLMGLTY